MKVVNKPIEMIATYTYDGIPTPSRFRMKLEDESLMVVQIKRMIHQERLKDISKNVFYIFNCESIIDDVLRQYEIKFVLNSCRWFLYKI